VSRKRLLCGEFSEFLIQAKQPEQLLSMNTDLVIIGGGAAGLMAGTTAGELGIRAVILERKHRPARKLLMCGNNRCNVSYNSSVPTMLEAYGEPVSAFLRPALEAFSPKDFRQWLSHNGLPTVVHQDGRIFPRSEKADDVLHLFLDLLRDQQIPLVLNCPVTSISRTGDGFRVVSDNLDLRTPHVLLATGGVSYPKTGSVGDGQRFAKQLGHKVEPYRPGLAGFELSESWLAPRSDLSVPDVVLHLIHQGRILGETRGEILFSRRCARGPAMVDASRIIARRNLPHCSFSIDLCPQISPDALAEQLRGCAKIQPGMKLVKVLGGLLPKEFSQAFCQKVIGISLQATGNALDQALTERIVRQLKHWELKPTGIRPLKEAMVTVGGVSLKQVDPQSMVSRICPGLFFAGEVLDIDGPTGGFNLHAAFATARLAVQTIAQRCPARKRERNGRNEPPPKRRRGSRQRTDKSE